MVLTGVDKRILFLGAGVAVVFCLGMGYFLTEDEVETVSGQSRVKEVKHVASGSITPKTGLEAGPDWNRLEKAQSTPMRESLPVIPFIQADHTIRNRTDEWFEEAAVLATEGYAESVYLEQVHLLLNHYRVIIKQGGYPTGLNVEITNALLGKNPKKIALLSQSHPRLNPQGELVDSWETPYFFHNESLNEIQIRSAGPDKTLYTQDDIKR